MNVKVLETKDHWFGITYKEDKEAVKSAFSKLIAEGMYPEQLWTQRVEQYIGVKKFETERGYCQLNDIVMNTLGTLIGQVIYKIISL